MTLFGDLRLLVLGYLFVKQKIEKKTKKKKQKKKKKTNKKKQKKQEGHDGPVTLT